MTSPVTKTIIAIGGGELRAKETKDIDAYIAARIKERANGGRGNALFFPTASHDSLPYFNTFRKTYTSDFDVKADVALLTKKDIPLEKIKDKISVADLIYVGGGNTVFMIDVWRKTGVLEMIKEAYERGVILAGLSAGAICWFEKMYSDADIMEGASGDYKIYDGLGFLRGTACPHYNERECEFDSVMSKNAGTAYAIENNAAIVFENGEPICALTSGGNAYLIRANGNGAINKEVIGIYGR